MTRRPFWLDPVLVAALGLCAALVLQAPAAAQRARNALTPPQLPPVSQTCPMHPDIVEEKPGTCPICKMNLVPVRLDVAHTCPIHSVILEDAPGTCPICRRPLIQVTVALNWTCASEPNVNHLEPGKCADGSTRVMKQTLRPHGNHNPQHGGQFFMAPDNWHHLEGTYPREGTFRVYLYDDYSKPLPADKMKQITGRVVTKETWDPKTRTSREESAFPLARSIEGSYLEARIGRQALPAQMTAKVKFKNGDPEYRFDFTFQGITKDPIAPVTSTTRAEPARPAPKGTSDATARAATPPSAPARPAGQPAPAPTAPARGAAPEPAIPAAADTSAATTPGTSSNELVAIAALDPDMAIRVEIPETVDAILAELKTRNDQIGALIQSGDFGAVYVPAFQAKDLALALEPRLDALPMPQRHSAEPALKTLVQTAWLLDAFGDLGNRQQLVDAYSVFSSSLSDLVTAFSARQ